MGDANRAMFWRIIRRLLGANRGRLFVMLLALGAGAAVTAALLNLQVDAKRRLTTEFRAFGANVVVDPSRSLASDKESGTFQEGEVTKTARALGNPASVVVPFLYVVARAQKGSDSFVPENRPQTQVVLAGTELLLLQKIAPGWQVPTYSGWEAEDYERLVEYCFVGTRVAEQLHLTKGDIVELFYERRVERLKVYGTVIAGGPEDNQIFVQLKVAQRLAHMNEQASLVQVNFPGTPLEIRNYRSALASKLPGVEVRPVTQFTEGEAKIYNRISGLLTATVGIVLLLTALCVMAAMTNVAMERKMDVGLMKAIGGATRRVIRLFLAEAALLGLLGGLIGAAAGIFLSMGLGKAVFGVAARPRLIVYPVAVALTVLVAILSAFPLRRLASLRPASVFRGEA
ncbi:MAG TPA: ABC transporter permease [Candidatus Acidoferrum sp.]|nr:ABC transporter permease [Candidatus Acidoferrum sp.]